MTVTWQRPIKVRNLNPLRLFLFFFALAYEKIFIKTHSTENIFVIRPETILFWGASVHLSARRFFRLGQWRGYISRLDLLWTVSNLVFFTLNQTGRLSWLAWAIMWLEFVSKIARVFKCDVHTGWASAPPQHWGIHTCIEVGLPNSRVASTHSVLYGCWVN